MLFRSEPHALVWILMPETLAGLWRQRLRWAEGGLQVFMAHLDLLVKPRQWNLLPLLLEPLASLIWAHLTLLLLLAEVARAWFWPAPGLLPTLSPHGFFALLLLTCLAQFAVSLWLDRPYDVGLARVGFWMIWYPLFFWFLTFATTVVASWRLLTGGHQQRARWISPDRGVRAG